MVMSSRPLVFKVSRLPTNAAAILVFIELSQRTVSVGGIEKMIVFGSDENVNKLNQLRLKEFSIYGIMMVLLLVFEGKQSQTLP